MVDHAHAGIRKSVGAAALEKRSVLRHSQKAVAHKGHIGDAAPVSRNRNGRIRAVNASVASHCRQIVSIQIKLEHIRGHKARPGRVEIAAGGKPGREAVTDLDSHQIAPAAHRQSGNTAQQIGRSIQAHRAGGASAVREGHG